MKTCTKCKKEFSLNYFCKDKNSKDGLSCWCRLCHKKSRKIYYDSHKTQLKIFRKSDRSKEIQKRYAQSDKGKISNNKRYQKYYSTTKGYLAFIYSSMKQRCQDINHPSYKNYGAVGIRCLFESSKDFIDYVLDVLCLDPRGLEIHRINNGNYEKGCVTFLTSAEHGLCHRNTDR